RVQAVLLRGGEPAAGLFGDEVRDDGAQAAGGGEVLGELLGAVLEDRVPVRHGHAVAAGGGDLADDVEEVLDAEARVERDVGGLLDGRAVHHRVGVRQADLDDVGAGGDDGVDVVDRPLDRR